MHVHTAKYNLYADRNNFASTNVDRTQITGVNSGMKKWNNQQQRLNDEHSERRSNHQIEDQ